MQLPRRRHRTLTYLAFATLGCVISLSLMGLGLRPVSAASPPNPLIVQSLTEAAQAEQHGKALYDMGQFAAAAEVWRQAAQIYANQGDQAGQARSLSNLSLAYQQLGHWPEATQAIATCLQLLQYDAESNVSTSELAVLAQALNTQGGLQLALGQSEQALATWRQATALYHQAEDEIGAIRSQINQAQAMRALGFYRRALDTLIEVNQILQTQPDSTLKSVGLQRLGDALRLVGDLGQSRQVLDQSWEISQQLQSNEQLGVVLFSLGNTSRAQQDREAALAFYQQANALSTSAQTRLQTQLAQLSLLIDMQQGATAQALWPRIQTQLDDLPINRTTIYNRINLARSLISLKQLEASASATRSDVLDWRSIAELLATAVQQAKELNDHRAETYALGNLAEVYEQTEQWSIAQDLTRQALQQAQAINAADIAYRWQWQLGRILKIQGKKPQAIAAYSEAVETVKSLRGDLVAINPDVQFSFREDVEPIYRQLVDLLLQPDDRNDVSQSNLAKARDVIESLQLAELDNFFREACLNTESVQIDQIDPQAAVIYPIILSDRLEVILRLPQQPLRHYTTAISEVSLQNSIEQLRQNLVIRSRRSFLPLSQQLYDWLLRPVAHDLEASSVDTLVFVLDGPLQNIPMAALHDGEQFLLENYRISLTPGLQLSDPKPLPREDLRTLAAGISQGRQGFSPLSHVPLELEEIEAEIPNSTVLLDQTFTSQSLQEKIESSPFPIVHIATHGQFSSNAAQTFILAWDDQINVVELDKILQSGFPRRESAIELLVLSACETLAGDKRAALGLAGVAVRAGARSTLATLWSVNDEATTELMGQFYQQLTKPNTTRAEALRQAQLTLLNNPQYQHPLYWAPYVLLGNWL